MTAKKIISLSASPEGFGQTPDTLDSEMFVSALPIQHTDTYYENEELGLYVGVWDTTDMIETAGPYPCDEFMWLLEGEVVIRNCSSGEMEKAKAGEAFVIPRGYDCQWQQSGYLRKFYVISEHPEEAIPAAPAHEGIVIPRADAVMTEVAGDAPFAITSGAKPQQNICYKDTRSRFFSGTWACEAFESEQRPFPYHEFAYVQDGSIAITDVEGIVEVFNAGDAFFLPEGVRCSAAVANSVRLFITVVKSN